MPALTEADFFDPKDAQMFKDYLNSELDRNPQIDYYQGTLNGGVSGALTRSIAGLLQMEYAGSHKAAHTNGEAQFRVPVNMRERDVMMVVSPSGRDVNRHIMEMILLADAAKRSSARFNGVTAILTNYAYGRQERQSDGEREPISAAVVAQLLAEVGVDRLITIDLHTDAVTGSIRRPWDKLYATKLLAETVITWGLQNPFVVAPDAGAMKRAKKFGMINNWSYDNLDKIRDQRAEGVVHMQETPRDFTGLDVVIVDDIISTGGTMAGVAKMLKRRGAQTVSLVATHGEFAGCGLELLYGNPAIDRILVTDTIPQPVRLWENLGMNNKIQVVSVAPLIAEAIQRLKTGGSIREM
ncbi:MAG: ribose-phosphate diphosphokinase [Patescibacteria group bacterium]|nr:ribose-phosphate diphosphokinase [Patescibacteria group bacterium]